MGQGGAVGDVVFADEQSIEAGEGALVVVLGDQEVPEVIASPLSLPAENSTDRANGIDRTVG